MNIKTVLLTLFVLAVGILGILGDFHIIRYSDYYVDVRVVSPFPPPSWNHDVKMRITSTKPDDEKIHSDQIVSLLACARMLAFEYHAKNGNSITIQCLDLETEEPIPGFTKLRLHPWYVTDYERRNIYVEKPNI